jgi:hypothetical protein
VEDASGGGRKGDNFEAGRRSPLVLSIANTSLDAIEQ